MGDSTVAFQNDVSGLTWGGSTVVSDHIRSTRGRVAFFNDNNAIQQTIRVGIGEHNPSFKLHLANDGGIISTGNTRGIGQPIPTSLTGPRLIWQPRNAAFRAGDSHLWEEANMGDYSFASGRGTFASGVASTALGDSTSAIGVFSTTMGKRTEARGMNTTAMGCLTLAIGQHSTVMGCETSTGSTGYVATAMGYRTAANGFAATAIGRDAIANADYSTAIGLNISNTHNWAIVLGRGINNSTLPLSSLAFNSLSVGFNSNVPTFTVTGSAGTAGSTGRVGIGTGATAPANKLEINSDAASANPGESGLRFTKLNSINSVANGVNRFNPPLVLSVDDNGDVILVPDATLGGGAVSACTPPTVPIQNRLTKWDTGSNVICNTIVYENVVTATRKRIGVDIFSGLQAKLDVIPNQIRF